MIEVVLGSMHLDHFVIYKKFCQRCIVSSLRFSWSVFYIVTRYVNVSCQVITFCDPTFKYGNDDKLAFEETEVKV